MLCHMLYMSHGVYPSKTSQDSSHCFQAKNSRSDSCPWHHAGPRSASKRNRQLWQCRCRRTGTRRPCRVQGWWRQPDLHSVCTGCQLQVIPSTSFQARNQLTTHKALLSTNDKKLYCPVCHVCMSSRQHSNAADCWLLYTVDNLAKHGRELMQSLRQPVTDTLIDVPQADAVALTCADRLLCAAGRAL